MKNLAIDHQLVLLGHSVEGTHCQTLTVDQEHDNVVDELDDGVLCAAGGSFIGVGLSKKMEIRLS
jgi:hypothetical protein